MDDIKKYNRFCVSEDNEYYIFVKDDCNAPLQILYHEYSKENEEEMKLDLSYLLGSNYSKNKY